MLKMGKNNTSLLDADYYALTRAQINYNKGMLDQEEWQSYFFRKLPEGWAYGITSGLQEVLDYIEGSYLSLEEAKWLESTCKGDLSSEFIDYLIQYKFKGNVYAIAEGTPIFPHEPILTVKSNPVDIQLFEKQILSIFNTSIPATTIATRCRIAAGNRSILDFSARRAPNAKLVARSAIIGGFNATAHVESARDFDLPYTGTMPHSFIQERYNPSIGFAQSEYKAFAEFAEQFPHNFLPLVDTYSIMMGVMNAIKVARSVCIPKGYRLKGIRIDSGDIELYTRMSRIMLDSAGFEDAKIYVTGDMDEYKIKTLLSSGAPIDGFGIGTRIASVVLNGVFKAMQINEIPIMKYSSDSVKTTMPGVHQVYRTYEPSGMYREDTISMIDEQLEGEPLLSEVMTDGKMNYSRMSISDIAKHCEQQLRVMPSTYRRIITEPTIGYPVYPVRISPKLNTLIETMNLRYKQEYVIEGRNWEEEFKTRYMGIMKAMKEQLNWDFPKDKV
jgi:nicotinate phosphoribosyltransferase